jgi:hypothetical protein
MAPTRTTAAVQVGAAVVPALPVVLAAVVPALPVVLAALVALAALAEEPPGAPAWPWDPAARRRRTPTAVEVVRSFRHRRGGDPPTPAPMPTVDREKTCHILWLLRQIAQWGGNPRRPRAARRTSPLTTCST